MNAARHGARVLLFLILAARSVGAAEFSVPGTAARIDTSGYLDGLVIGALGGPRQRPQLTTQVSLAAKINRALRTQLTLRGQAGGPFEGGEPGLLNLVHEFQNRTPGLEFNEAWVDLRLERAEVRAGIQKFAWGKLDGGPPTDVLTPRDLHDPLVRDFEESKIGIPALQLTYFPPPFPSIAMSDLRASLIYIPIAVPPRGPLVDERWFPPTVRSGDLVIPEEQAERLVNAIVQARNPGAPPIDIRAPVRIPLALRARNARPPARFDAGGIAFRLSGTVRQMDWSVSHYTGPETGSNAELDVMASCQDCLAALLRGELPMRVAASLRQAHDIIHMTGADWSAAFGGATLRAEFAAFQNRPYLRINSDIVAGAFAEDAVSRYGPPLLFEGKAQVPVEELYPDRDSIEWGVGADYLVRGFLPMIQVNQVIFTDGGPEQLLADPETRLLTSVKRAFLQDALELELRGVYAFERESWVVNPRATYRYGDHLRFRFGYLGIGGPHSSTIGQYSRNDEFVLEARYVF